VKVRVLDEVKYSDRTAVMRKKNCCEIRRNIQNNIGPAGTLVEIYADLLKTLPTKQIGQVLSKIDSSSDTFEQGRPLRVKARIKPVLKWIMKGQKKAAIRMAHDGVFAATMYVARRRCELGRHRMNMMLRFMFRDISGFNTAAVQVGRKKKTGKRFTVWLE
jgi:hypothetical protein